MYNIILQANIPTSYWTFPSLFIMFVIILVPILLIRQLAKFDWVRDVLDRMKYILDRKKHVIFTFCLIVFFVCIVYHWKDQLVFPGTVWVIVQTITILSLLALFSRLANSYNEVVAKEKKSEEDIKKRKKLISRLTYLIALSSTVIPFFLNSWGVEIIGNLDPTPYTSYFSKVTTFVDNAKVWCVSMTMVVFLADNILNRMATPISCVDDVKDIKKFCLYLRSFNTDSNKEEKLICKVARRLYPVYAIGDPNKIMQPNGAERIYVTDEKWKDVVKELSTKSKLVLLRIGQTDGTMWEIRNLIEAQLVYKTIFIAYDEEDYRYFSEKVLDILGLDIMGLEFNTKKPIAFFLDSTNCIRMREISGEWDVESLINEYLSCTPELDEEYAQDLELRQHNLKYMFDKNRIPDSVRRSLNWGILSPIVNMRHMSWLVWGIFLLTIVLAFEIATVFSIVYESLPLMLVLSPIYVFLLLMFLYGNRIEWAAGSWSSDTQFLRKQKHEAKLMWVSVILSVIFSVLYVIIDPISRA